MKLLPTTFYTNRDAGGYNRVRRYVQDLDLPSFQCLVIPMHLPVKRHWQRVVSLQYTLTDFCGTFEPKMPHLQIVDFDSYILQCFDSLRKTDVKLEQKIR